MRRTQKGTVRKRRNNSAGFTLIEMIVTVAIIAIFSGVVVTLITTGSSLFRGVSGNTKSQANAQETLDEIEDLIIDANRSVYYAYGSGTDMGDQISSDIDDSNSLSKTFIVCNEYENGDGTSRYVFDVLDWVGNKGKLYYSQREYTKASSSTEEESEEENNSGTQQTADVNAVAAFASEDNGNTDISDGNSDTAKDSKELISRSVFAEGIENFTADVTKVESERIVRFRLTTENNGKKVKTLHTVNLRNRIQVMKPDDAFATAGSTDVGIKIVGAPDSIDAGKSKILSYDLIGDGPIDPTTLEWKITDGTDRGYFPELDPTYGKLTINADATGTITVIVSAKTADGKQTVTSAPVTIKINNTKIVNGIKANTREVILGVDSEKDVTYYLDNYVKWVEVYSDATDSGDSYINVSWSGKGTGINIDASGKVTVAKDAGTSVENGTVIVNAMYTYNGNTYTGNIALKLARLEIMQPSDEYYMGDKKPEPSYEYRVGGESAALPELPQFSVKDMVYEAGSFFTEAENGEKYASAFINLENGSKVIGHASFAVNTNIKRMNVWCKHAATQGNVTAVYRGQSYNCQSYGTGYGFYTDISLNDNWNYKSIWKILNKSSADTRFEGNGEIGFVDNTATNNPRGPGSDTLIVGKDEKGFVLSVELIVYSTEWGHYNEAIARYKGSVNVSVMQKLEISSPPSEVIKGENYDLKVSALISTLLNPYSADTEKQYKVESQKISGESWSLEPLNGKFDIAGKEPWTVDMEQKDARLTVSIRTSSVNWIAPGKTAGGGIVDSVSNSIQLKVLEPSN